MPCVTLHFKVVALQGTPNSFTLDSPFESICDIHRDRSYCAVSLLNGRSCSGKLVDEVTVESESDSKD